MKLEKSMKELKKVHEKIAQIMKTLKTVIL